LAYGLGAAAGAYAAYVGTTWLRYGRVKAGGGDVPDALLDRFIPTYEVAERHHIRVAAPADITFAAACDVDLQQSPTIGAIFKARELILGSSSDAQKRPRGLVALTRSLGWGVLAEVPDREIVLGAVTRPWDADVVFRAVPPEDFATFNDPDYVKIVWTLRADEVGERESVARTETRVVSTDELARERFRKYWSVFSPGIALIRLATLKLVKADAERRVRLGTATTVDRFTLVGAGDLDPEC
jgi:hypothetical protein